MDKTMTERISEIQQRRKRDAAIIAQGLRERKRSNRAEKKIILENIGNGIEWAMSIRDEQMPILNSTLTEAEKRDKEAVAVKNYFRNLKTVINGCLDALEVFPP